MLRPGALSFKKHRQRAGTMRIRMQCWQWAGIMRDRGAHRASSTAVRTSYKEAAPKGKANGDRVSGTTARDVAAGCTSYKQVTPAGR